MWQQRDRGRSSWQSHRSHRGRHTKHVRNSPDTPLSSQQPLPQTAELSAKTPLLELHHKIKSLGFPQSCKCVLELLDKHFKATIAGDVATKNSLPNRDSLLFLVRAFVLCLPQGRRQHGKEEPSLSPLQELQLLEELREVLGKKESVEHCYCLFDALFGRGGVGDEEEFQNDDVITGGRHRVLYKLLSLSVSIESGSILSCTAVWMKNHPRETLHLALAVYEDFCVLLPDAGSALFRLAVISPHTAYHLTQAFTTLFPFYRGKEPLLLGVPSVDPHPPIQLVRLVLHWVETRPEYLCQQQAIEGVSNLPLMYPQTVQSSTPSSKSPLAGLVQWCVLAPLASTTNTYPLPDDARGTQRGASQLGHGANPLPPQELDFSSLAGALHVRLLSLVLAHSKILAGWAFTVGDLCTIVGTLVGYSGWVAGVLGGAPPSSFSSRGELLSAKMEECVERLAQFLQIAHSVGVIVMKADELSQVTSSLPANRLMSLFIERHKQS